MLFQTSTAAPLFAMCLLIYLDGGPRYLRAGYWYAIYTSSRTGKDHIRKHGRQSRCHPELENEDGEDGRPAKTATEAVRRHRRMHVLGRAPTSADPTPFPRRKEEETGGEILPAKSNEPSLGCPLACVTDLENRATNSVLQTMNIRLLLDFNKKKLSSQPQRRIKQVLGDCKCPRSYVALQR